MDVIQYNQITNPQSKFRRNQSNQNNPNDPPEPKSMNYISGASYSKFKKGGTDYKSNSDLNVIRGKKSPHLTCAQSNLNVDEKISTNMRDILNKQKSRDIIKDKSPTSRNRLDMRGTSQKKIADIRGTSQKKIVDLRGTSQKKIVDIRGTSQKKIVDLRGTSQRRIDKSKEKSHIPGQALRYNTNLTNKQIDNIRPPTDKKNLRNNKK